MSTKHKLPENIDQIESFYKSEFTGMEMPVNDAMWDNISHSLDNMPVAGSSSSSFLSKLFSGKGIFFSVGVIISATITFCLFMQKTEKANVANKVMVKTLSPSSLPQPTLANGIVKEERVDKTAKKDLIKTDNTASVPFEKTKTPENALPEAVLENTQPDNKVETPISNTNTNETEIATETKTPKSFYDKMLQAKKDSAKPLFVPQK